MLCGGVMIAKEDYDHNFMQEIDGGMMGVLQAYVLTVCLFLKAIFPYIPPFIFPLIFTYVNMSYFLISFGN